MSQIPKHKKEIILGETIEVVGFGHLDPPFFIVCNFAL